MDEPTAHVVIGMDLHKRTVTVEVMRGDDAVLGGGRFAMDAAGHAELLRYARHWPERVWAIEGCQGIGRHVANRLLKDSEQVVDVPAKLSARVRQFATGQGRKTDATDAHSIALVGTRMAGLRPVVDDEELAVLRILVDRRRCLGEEHTRKIAQVHALLLELIPGGAKTFLSAAQARRLLASVRPKDAAGKARKRVAAELVADLERIYARSKAADKELTAAASGRHLAARPPRHRALRRRPTARGGRPHHPVPGPQPLRVLDRNRPRRRLQRGSHPPPARLRREPTNQPRPAHHGHRPTAQRHRRRAYYDRKKAAGKTSMEAMRCLKRRLSDIVYHAMVDDLTRMHGTGPRGQRGNDSDSSAAGSHPDIGSSDKPLPGPANTKPKTPLPKAG
jgi:hypothetical protein